MGSFSTTFRPFSTQPGVSRSAWTKGSNFVVKLSKSFQALSHYLVTPNFKIDFLPWWENYQRTNRRKLQQNWSPRSCDIAMNSQVIFVFIYSKLCFQPNTYLVKVQVRDMIRNQIIYCPRLQKLKNVACFNYIHEQGTIYYNGLIRYLCFKSCWHLDTHFGAH